MVIEFQCNREDIQIDVPANKRASQLLFDIGINSLKYSECNTGECGNCIILLNNTLVPSCMLPAFALRNKSIVTFEGIKQTETFTIIQDIFESHNATPCPICESSKYLIAASVYDNRVLNEEIQEKFFNRFLCECTDIRNFQAALKTISQQRHKHG